MELIADGLLLLAAAVATIYCVVLSRRLRKLTRLEDGLGQAILSLSARVDEMSKALETAKTSTKSAVGDLDNRVMRADGAATRLDALVMNAEAQSKQFRDIFRKAALEAVAARAAAHTDVGEETKTSKNDDEPKSTGPIAAEASESPEAADKPAEEETSAAPSASEPTKVAEAPGAQDQAASLEPANDAAESAPAVQGESTADATGEQVAASVEAKPVASPEKAKSATDDVSDAINELMKTKDGDDDAFAKRLVDALAAMEPTTEARPV